MSYNQPDAIDCSGQLSTTLASNTAKSVKVTVATKELWKLTQAEIHNGDDVSRLCEIRILDASDNIVEVIHSETLAAGAYAGPNFNKKWILGGYKLEFYWAAGGASTGGTAHYSYTVERWMSVRT